MAERADPSPRLPRAASAAFALAPLAAFAGCGADGPDERPNVVLVVLDALAADHVSHLGYERATTPTLDALAAEGVSFGRAFAPAPYTLASIPSLLTGRRPATHGLTTKVNVLAEHELTLAEWLRTHGWVTLGACANPNGSSLFGNDQGFSVWEELFLPGEGEEADFVDRANRELVVPRAEDFVPLVEDWLARGAATVDPALLYLHVLEPHSPYHVGEPWRSRWLDPAYDGPFSDGETRPLVNSNKGEVAIDAADRRAAVDLYDATLAYADAQLGLVLDALRDAGVYEESLVVVTSDHGEAFWQHGLWGHNEHLYGEQVRVPLVVKPPASWGWERGARPAALASTLDVFPSLVEWLDLPRPPSLLDGEPLGAFVADPGRRTPARELLLRSNHKVPDVALRTVATNTILRQDEDTGAEVALEHYDLVADPGEHDDLAPELGEALERVRARLAAYALEELRAKAVRDQALTVRELRLLERLGYAE